MKKCIKVLSIVFMLALFAGITACGKEDNVQSTVESHASAADLVGKWKGIGNELSTLTLGTDGSYKDDAGDVYVIGTYTVDSISGTITVNEKEYGLVFVYSYELSDDNLTLQMNGGLPRTFSRQ